MEEPDGRGPRSLISDRERDGPSSELLVASLWRLCVGCDRLEDKDGGRCWHSPGAYLDLFSFISGTRSGTGTGIFNNTFDDKSDEQDLQLWWSWRE